MVCQVFENSADAFDLGNRKARYAHKHWIVWQTADGWKAGQLCESVLREAVADVQGKKFFHVGPHAGFHWSNVGPNMAQMWLRNIEAGCFFTKD